MTVGAFALTAAPFVINVDEVAAQSTFTHSEVHVPGTKAYASAERTVQSVVDLGEVASMVDLQPLLLETYTNFTPTVTFNYSGNLATFKENFTDMQQALVMAEDKDYLRGTLQGYDYTISGTKVTLNLKYFTTAEQEQKVNKKIAEIAKAIFTAEMSDLEKVMAVNEYIVLNSVYSTATKASPHSAYALLFEGKGVCQAYALTAQRLLEAAELDARYVTGEGKGVAHAWNAVKVNGSWYYLDTTWNDPSFDGADRPGMVGYGYFLGNTQKFKEDHTWDEALSPSSLGATYNYFHKAFGAVKVGNELFYTDRNDNYNLYKMNYTLGTPTKVLDKMAPYFAVYENVIYFADYSAGGNKYLTSYDLNTGTLEVLDKVASKNIYVDNYKLRYDAAGTSKIYELPLNEVDIVVRAVYDAIVELTEESTKAELDAAREQYDALADNKSKVSNIAKLEDLEAKYKENKTAAEAVDVLLETVTIESTYAELKAVFDEYAKLTAIQKKLIADKGKFEALQEKYSEYSVSLSKVLTAIKNLKASSATYIKDTLAARTAYDDLSEELKALITTYETLTKAEEAIVVPKAVYDLIEVIESEDLDSILSAREAYTALSAANKKYMTNLKTLTDAEKLQKATLDAVKAIRAIDPASEKFVAQVKAAVKAFEKSAVKDALIADEIVLLNDYSAQATVFEQISKLKLTSTKLIADAKEANIALKALEKTNYVTNIQMLTDALNAIEPAEKVMDEIDALQNKATVAETEAARASYNALTNQQKKYITNMKILTTEEKRIKQAVNTIKAIEAINPTDRKFLSQVKKATNTYKKVSDKSLVTNSALLEEYEKQATVYEQISKLKLTNAKLIAMAGEADMAFKALEKTNYITNAQMLTDALKAIEPAEKVVAEIAALQNATVAEIMTVRASYNTLTKQEKKYVTNLKVLTAEEKRVKQAASAIKVIDAIDPAGKKFVSQVKKATNAYNKVSDKSLVTNAALLTDYQQQAPVYEKISKLKLTSTKLITEARAAETEYKQLTKNNYVTNVQLLTNAIAAIEPAEAVVAQIEALVAEPVAAQVQAARAAYTALSKQQQKYVTNIKTLTVAEKSVKE